MNNNWKAILGLVDLINSKVVELTMQNEQSHSSEKELLQILLSREFDNEAKLVGQIGFDSIHTREYRRFKQNFREYLFNNIFQTIYHKEGDNPAEHFKYSFYKNLMLNDFITGSATNINIPIDIKELKAEAQKYEFTNLELIINYFELDMCLGKVNYPHHLTDYISEVVKLNEKVNFELKMHINYLKIQDIISGEKPDHLYMDIINECKDSLVNLGNTYRSNYIYYAIQFDWYNYKNEDSKIIELCFEAIQTFIHQSIYKGEFHLKILPSILRLRRSDLPANFFDELDKYFQGHQKEWFQIKHYQFIYYCQNSKYLLALDVCTSVRSNKHLIQLPDLTKEQWDINIYYILLVGKLGLYKPPKKNSALSNKRLINISNKSRQLKDTKNILMSIMQALDYAAQKKLLWIIL